MRKKRRRSTKDLNTGFEESQVPMLKQIVFAKNSILKRKILAERKDRWSLKISGQELYKIKLEPRSQMEKTNEELSKELSFQVIYRWMRNNNNSSTSENDWD